MVSPRLTTYHKEADTQLTIDPAIEPESITFNLFKKDDGFYLYQIIVDGVGSAMPHDYSKQFWNEEVVQMRTGEKIVAAKVTVNEGRDLPVSISLIIFDTL